ncbi:Protein fantom, partial [Stegodyphus mimosarum]
MEEAFKNFKEKLKAMKYIHSNKEVSTAAMNLLKLPYDKDSHVNQLHVKIIRGLNLKSSRRDIQPSAFCVYKFYDLPDQDTAIIPASNNPEFSDHRTFNLFIDSDLDKYINTEDLFIYVFDDNEPDITSHLGKAIIPLHLLSHNKPIKGIFDLQKGKETGYG